MQSIQLAKFCASCVVLWVGLAAPSDACGQTLDDYVGGRMEKHKIPGLAIIVARDGELLEARGYGLANIEHDVPAAPETIFEIASVTKPITATGIMLLVQDGRLGLDEPVGSYLDGVPAAWSGITIRHLLSHTSGLKDYINDGLADRQRDQTSRELIEAVFRERLIFAPGTRWSYSNTNYLLLELLIESVTGTTFDQFLAERIFRPLGMAATARRDLRAIMPRRAAHYDLRDGNVVNATYLNPTVWDHADGGLVSTALDLFRFDSALAGAALVQHDILRRMWTASQLPNGERAPYGLGWEIGDVRGIRYVGHSGGRAGVSSSYVRYVDANLTVIALSNLSGINLRREVVEGVAGIYEPMLRPLDQRPAEANPDSSHLATALAYLRDVARGNQESAFVTSGNREAVSTPQRSLTQMLDELESFDSLGCDALDGRALERRGTQIARVCNYRMVTRTRLAYLWLYLASGGQIADQVADVVDR